MGELRDEIERVEAANVPLPLPTDDAEGDLLASASGSASGPGSGGVDSPLGPL